MEMNREAVPLAKPELVLSFMAEPPEEHQPDFPLWPAKEKEWHPWLARMLGLGSLPYNLGFLAVVSSVLPVLVAIFLLSADMDLDVHTYTHRAVATLVKTDATYYLAGTGDILQPVPAGQAAFHGTPTDDSEFWSQHTLTYDDDGSTGNRITPSRPVTARFFETLTFF